jgi:hypothetical protein
MGSELPTSVRYVKNGPAGRWWQEAKANGQIHLGWKNTPKELLLKPDFSEIERLLRAEFADRPGATQDFKALKTLLDAPSKHIWITFEDGCLWWCTVADGATVNPDGEGDYRGNFWLDCDRPWSNKSIKGKLLVKRDLPGVATSTAGFRATVCEPRGWQSILRIIGGEVDPDVTKASDARGAYQEAIQKVIQQLSWQDFEQLIEFILARTGWTRVSTLERTREGTDVEAENLTADERAFVQVKSIAAQTVLDDYVGRFNKQRDSYARMIFAVHSPKGTLKAPVDLPVHLWTGDRVADLVVRLGLGQWVESRLS